MNERIKELEIETDAWCDANFPANWTDRVDEFLPLWNKKFAELIVRECLAQVDKVDVMLEDDKEKTGVAWVGYAIEKHFGVEE